MDAKDVISFMLSRGEKISGKTLQNYAKWQLVTPPRTGFAAGQRGRFTAYASDVPFEAYAAKKMLAQKVSVGAVRLAREAALRREIPAWFSGNSDHMVVWMPREIERTSPLEWVRLFLDAKYDKGVALPETLVGTSHHFWNVNDLPEGLVIVTSSQFPRKIKIVVKEVQNHKWNTLEELDFCIV